MFRVAVDDLCACFDSKGKVKAAKIRRASTSLMSKTDTSAWAWTFTMEDVQHMDN